MEHLKRQAAQVGVLSLHVTDAAMYGSGNA